MFKKVGVRIGVILYFVFFISKFLFLDIRFLQIIFYHNLETGVRRLRIGHIKEHTLIFEKNKIEIVILVDEKFNMRIYADRRKAKTGFLNDQGKVTYDQDMGIIRKQMPTIKDYIEKYKESNPDVKIVGVVPNGNLLWNDWFVAVINGKLYHRYNEPIKKRIYSMLVVWKNGEVSIENIKFQNNKVIKADTQEDITNEINYATFGQLIVDNGKIVNIAKDDRFLQWGDLRHLFKFPRIKWNNITNVLNIQIRGTLGGSLYFGMHYLLQDKNKNILRDAVEGKTIEIPIKEEIFELLKEEVQNQQELKNLINGKFGQIIKILEEGSERQNYEKIASDNLKQGQYRIVNDKLIINLKAGIYPHSLIGITDDGKILVTAIIGKSGREGATIQQAAQLLLTKGAQKVIMLANGGDVVLWGKNNEVLVPSSENRENFSSIILFIEKN